MANEDPETITDLEHLSTEIVSAYVSHNALGPSDLPKLIGDVHRALSSLGGPSRTPQVLQKEPAISIRKSVSDHAIVCLEDGLKFKSIKRHLMAHHQLTPEKYREKWRLPKDYPMVAPSYSVTRSNLAKAAGLGKVGVVRRGRKRSSK